ncbi:MAG: anthranilate/aminodeoxychorismate synthase component II [Candidatus Mycalebacterium zealandia]|nr:MAG: anthranilate/aminodeoxychorismate synthase component II [Candidatus Mycalebacterium zealandia]
MILMIDNYDSFTYNLVHYFEELGKEVSTHRNDEILPDGIEKLSPEMIVISPGPCSPEKSGVSVEIVKKFAGKTPILGVCLGHQAIAHAFGAEIVRAERLLHGKTSEIHHTGAGVFKDLPSPFNATRYHSLIVAPDTLPEDFEVTAWTDTDEIMGIKHKQFSGSGRLEGVQFHPESILTEHGKDLLKNFIEG